MIGVLVSPLVAWLIQLIWNFFAGYYGFKGLTYGAAYLIIVAIGLIVWFIYLVNPETYNKITKE